MIGPTIREKDGLAMSSRNRFLSSQDRQKASILYQALKCGQEVYENNSVSRSDILAAVMQKLNDVEVDYISLVDPFLLHEVENVGKEGGILSGAIRFGNTRIIDNVLLGVNTNLL